MPIHAPQFSSMPSADSIRTTIGSPDPAKRRTHAHSAAAGGEGGAGEKANATRPQPHGPETLERLVVQVRVRERSAEASKARAGVPFGLLCCDGCMPYAAI